MPIESGLGERLAAAHAIKWRSREGYGDNGGRYDAMGYKVNKGVGKGGYAYVDLKELEASIQRVTRFLRKEVGREFADAAIKQVYMESAEIFQAEMRKLAPQATRAYSAGKRMRKSRKTGNSVHHASDIRLPGTLRRSITIFPGRDVAAYIGPRRKKAKYGDKKADGFYGYWQDQGTRRGIKGIEFVQNAYKNKEAQVVADIRRRIDEKVKTIDAKLNGAGT